MMWGGLFGLQIDSIQLMTDSELKRSKGYGFITVSLVTRQSEQAVLGTVYQDGDASC